MRIERNQPACASGALSWPRFARVNGHNTIDDAGLIGGDYLAQEKLHGIRAFLLPDGSLIGRNGPLNRKATGIEGAVLDGELMAGGEFITFDCVRFNGQPVDAEPIEFRLSLLERLPVRRAQVCFDNLGQFAREVVEAGGEGIVAKLKGSSYARGGWLRFRREMTLDFIVTGYNGSSVSVMTREGVPAGKVHCTEPLENGTIVEVKAIKFTKSGKLRNGRVVRVRHDLT